VKILGPSGPGRLYRLAAALTLVVAVALTAAVALGSGSFVHRLVAEHGLLEWLQVGLFAGAALAAARRGVLAWAARRSGAADVLLAAGFGSLVISELELPRLVLGKSIKIGRLTREVAAGSPREIVFVLLVAALALAVGVYAVRHRADLVAAASSALGEGWGRLLLGGLALLLVTALLERPLNQMMGPLPRPLVEESLELLAALYCVLASTARPGVLRTAGFRVLAPRLPP
jgi:hypothetical protein